MLTVLNRTTLQVGLCLGSRIDSTAVSFGFRRASCCLVAAAVVVFLAMLAILVKTSSRIASASGRHKQMNVTKLTSFLHECHCYERHVASTTHHALHNEQPMHRLDDIHNDDIWAAAILLYLACSDINHSMDALVNHRIHGL